MKKAIIFVLVGILLAGCTAAEPVPTATATATPQPSATSQPTATQTLPPPTATATSTAVPSPTATPAPKFTHIYAFGDGFSDNGNCYKDLKEKFEKKEIPADDWEVYIKNRVGEGLSARSVEVLANLLNADLTDYAICGATSGYDRLEFKDRGLLWQVDKFKSDLNGKTTDAGALFFIEIGSEDFNKHWYGEGDLSDKAVTQHADETVANISTAVTRLAEAGAKQFLVGAGLDWANFPIVVDSKNALGTDIYKPVLVFQNRKRSTLPVVMDGLAGQLNVKISVFDFIAAEERIRGNASQYGITNLTDPCTNIPAFKEAVKICESPDEYYYWGIIDYSRRVLQIFAEMMAEQLSK